MAVQVGRTNDLHKKQHPATACMEIMTAQGQKSTYCIACRWGISGRRQDKLSRRALSARSRQDQNTTCRRSKRLSRRLNRTLARRIAPSTTPIFHVVAKAPDWVFPK